VMVTRGMLDAVRSDEELAYVLAKEIAQAALTRTAVPGMRQMMDRLALVTPPSSGRLPSIAPYVPVTDATADKLALYMLMRSGVAIDGAPAFWQRLASAHPATIANGHTALHPSTSYRVSVIRAVTASIKQRQLNDLPLVP
jgi:predicted Zn-dependent protease